MTCSRRSDPDAHVLRGEGRRWDAGQGTGSRPVPAHGHDSVSGRILARVIRLYQIVLSPLMSPSCRHLPTCSDYAIEALCGHGALRGSWLAIRRIARCHPFGTSGLDPVPPRRTP